MSLTAAPSLVLATPAICCSIFSPTSSDLLPFISLCLSSFLPLSCLLWFYLFSKLSIPLKYYITCLVIASAFIANFMELISFYFFQKSSFKAIFIENFILLLVYFLTFETLFMKVCGRVKAILLFLSFENYKSSPILFRVLCRKPRWPLALVIAIPSSISAFIVLMFVIYYF